MSLKDFEIITQLGKGAFASVFKVRRKEDHCIYALKRVIIDKLSKKEQENSLNEVRILASVKHVNIIGYKEAFFDEPSKTLNIIMEFADDGDLNSKINQYKAHNKKFSEQTIWSYLIQMLQGLKALHDKHIMHRDLKSANVFLMKNGTCKLGDLNVSKVVKMGMVHTQTGTPYYASPEVWKDRPYSYKSDLWSIGCVAYELCMLHVPFRGKSMDDLYKNVCRGRYEKIKGYTDDLSNVIAMLLRIDDKTRPSCDDALNNPVVKKYFSCVQEPDNSEAINNKNEKEMLLGTIKFRDIKEIKTKLPKTKNYEDEDEQAKGKEMPNLNYNPINSSNNKSNVKPNSNIKVYKNPTEKPKENKPKVSEKKVDSKKRSASAHPGKRGVDRNNGIQSAKTNPHQSNANQSDKKAIGVNNGKKPLGKPIGRPLSSKPIKKPEPKKKEIITKTPNNINHVKVSKRPQSVKPKTEKKSKNVPLKQDRPFSSNPLRGGEQIKTPSKNIVKGPKFAKPKINNDPERRMLMNPIKIKETPGAKKNQNYFLQCNVHNSNSNTGGQYKNYHINVKNKL